MAGQQGEERLQVRRSWMWDADAEWRWRRALRLLLEASVAAEASGGQEGGDEQCGGGLRAGLDRTASRAADD
jgi:hypothetical protein